MGRMTRRSSRCGTARERSPGGSCEARAWLIVVKMALYDGTAACGPRRCVLGGNGSEQLCNPPTHCSLTAGGGRRWPAANHRWASAARSLCTAWLCQNRSWPRNMFTGTQFGGLCSLQRLTGRLRPSSGIHSLQLSSDLNFPEAAKRSAVCRSATN